MGAIRDSMGHPSELLALAKYKLKARRAAALSARPAGSPWAFCYDMLTRVSRSFSLVIMELDDELRDPVCIFYLVLRGLDTVEDDTSVPAQDRIPLLLDFHNKLDLPGWNVHGFGDADHYIQLLQSFHLVIECYSQLQPKYQAVIRDITRQMGAGMVEHIRDVECDTVANYDLYCHYVAGLVGLGLSRMFSDSGRESPAVARREDLSNSMGLFLQKTNIIRDYLEDMNDARTFWPREIWQHHSKHLSNLALPANRPAAVECLNAMVTDALRHVPDCIQYMDQIKNTHVFNFVAIPQVMAIGTLSECFNNPDVFTGVVKLRKGLTAKLVLNTQDMTALHRLFFDFANIMMRKVDHKDPNAHATKAALDRIIDLSLPHIPTTPDLTVPNRIAVFLFVLICFGMMQRREVDAGSSWLARQDGIPVPQDMLLIAGLVLVTTYLVTFFGLQFVKPAQPQLPQRPAQTSNAI